VQIRKKKTAVKTKILFAIVLDIRIEILYKITSIKTAGQQSWKELHLKRRPENATASGKIPKGADVWPMSAGWWTGFQGNKPYNRTLRESLK
jgi:hypothetical protein